MKPILRRIFAPVIGGAGGGAPWYETVPLIAAYQPLGAASLAASYVNILNPGTFDIVLTGGKTAPALDANGWTWDGLTAQMMLTLAMNISETTCIIARVLTTGAGGDGNGRLFQTSAGLMVVIPNNGTNISTINTTTVTSATKITTAKVIAMAGKTVYVDGVAAYTHGAGAISATVLTLGNVSTGSRQLAGSIQSLAIANSLDATQAATLATAMNAVPYPP